jgi:hypothetical protein
MPPSHFHPFSRRRALSAPPARRTGRTCPATIPLPREIIKAADTRHSYELNNTAVLKERATFSLRLESPVRKPRPTLPFLPARPSLCTRYRPMRRKDRAIQLRLIPGDDSPREQTKRAPTPHADLIGRCFFDGLSSVAVTDVCHLNPAQVMVEREMDGRRWSISAGLIRLIVGRERKRRTASSESCRVSTVRSARLPCPP